MYNWCIFGIVCASDVNIEELMSQSKPLGPWWSLLCPWSCQCPWRQVASGGPTTYPVTAGFSSPHFCGDALEDGLDVGPVGRKWVVQLLTRGLGLHEILKDSPPRPPIVSFLAVGGSAHKKVMNKLSPQGKSVSGCGPSDSRQETKRLGERVSKAPEDISIALSEEAVIPSGSCSDCFYQSGCMLSSTAGFWTERTMQRFQELHSLSSREKATVVHSFPASPRRTE